MSQSHLHKYTRSLALGILQHFPRMRFFVRRAYWSWRKHEYDSKYRILDTQPNTVLFESYGGRFIACSPLALYQEMCARKDFADWDFFWSVKDVAAGERILEGLESKGRAEIVERGSKDYYQVCAKSAYWIVNNRMPEWIEPNADQTFIQCWHGTPLKRLGFDLDKDAKAALNTSSELSWRFFLDAKKWKYLISPSSYTSQHLQSAFNTSSLSGLRLIEAGYPRNDALSNTLNAPNRQELIDQIKKNLKIPADKKVILYAPTWRDNNYKSGSGYVLNEALDLSAMADSFRDEWVILLRTHYYVANKLDITDLTGFAIDVSKHNDINDLYLVADVLLTDYSSVVFDFANTTKPILFYWPDLFVYENELHGFYMDPAALPGPKCLTLHELISEVDDIASWYERYGSNYKSFRDKFSPLDDGKASKRVIDLVFKARIDEV